MLNTNGSIMKNLLILLIILITSSSLSLSQVTIENLESPQINQNDTFNEISEKFNNYYQKINELNPNQEDPLKGQGFKPYKRWEYFWSTRVKVGGTLPNRKDINNSYSEFKQNYLSNKNNTIQAGNEWIPLGPFNQPGAGVGRINAIAIHPTNTNIIYVGAATGGVWKSTNGGSTWSESVTPDVYSLGISDISISKTNPEVILAATGDKAGIGSNNNYGAYSSGLLLSYNGGDSWEEINIDAIANSIEQSNGVVLFRSLIDYTDSQRFVVASNYGVFESTNSGVSWTRTITNYCRDLEMNPSNPKILYGAFFTGNGQYTVLRSVNNVWATNKAYNISGCGRVELTVNPSFPNLCYGIASDNIGGGGFLSVFKSENSGDTWNEVSSKSGHPNYLYFTPDGLNNGQLAQGGQGNYDLALSISPKNKSHVIIGGINNWKTTNGGNSYSLKTFQQGFGNVDAVHPDQHTMVYDSKGVLYVGNDGGIYKSTNEGEDWTDISAGLNITQYYKFGQDPNNKNIILAGSQDNGTHRKINSDQWVVSLGGDGFDCDIDPNNTNIMYASLYSGSTGVFYKSTNSGQNWLLDNPILFPSAFGETTNWVTPLTIDKSNSDIYIGYQNVYKSTNQGNNWQRISNFGFQQNLNITEIALAPSNSQHIYLAVYNQVLRTTDGGNNWSSIYTTPNTQITVRNLTVNPDNPNEVFAVLSGYMPSNKVIKISNGSVTNISGDLPNFSTNTIVYQKGSNERLYVGTDIGVFTKDAATDWQYMNEGMPQVIISELKIHYPTGMLRAATYGRGFWEVPVNNCTLDVPIITTDNDIVNNSIKVCNNETVELRLKEGDYDSFEWSTGQTSRKINPTKNGIYFVTVFDKDGCEVKSESYSVEFIDFDDIKIVDENQNTITETSFCEGDSVLIKYFGFYKDIEWSDGTKNQRNLWVKEAGNYFVKGSTTNGNCATTSQTVKVIKLTSPNEPDISLNSEGVLITTANADTYRWYKNGNLILGESNNSYKPIEEGEYNVEIEVDGFDCPKASEVYNFSITDIKIVENNGEFGVTPNPFSDYLTLENRSQEIINEIRIIDLLGQEIARFDTFNSNSEIELNLNLFSSGTYIIYIVTDNRIVTQKIVKN